MKLSKIQQAVINQLGYDELTDECKENLSDISNHGVDGGFSGFIYYTDTIKFFDDNRGIILNELYEQSTAFGQSVFDMVKGFNCIDGTDHETLSALNAVLSGIDSEYESDITQVKNCLAWFAAEQVAFQLNND